ncbi:hypothetical protein [Comamonas terrae]|uniref:DUF3168 domain-containing protein n=1 Tax=Comamonas terrae TaxID=673548 RepID=A0ABW5UR02_9BURK|nr:hypothetical protein [Comamonas terrae]
MAAETTIFWRAAADLSALLSSRIDPGVQVFMRRARGLPQSVKKCVVIRVPLARASTGAGQGVPSLWGSHLQVDCLVRSCSDVDAQADALMGSVIEALKPEFTRGTPVAGMELAQIEWDDDYDGESSVCISISYQLRHAGPFGGGVRVKT